MIVKGLEKHCENCAEADLYVESYHLQVCGKATPATHALHCRKEDMCKQIRKELIKEFKEKWGIEDESI